MIDSKQISYLSLGVSNLNTWTVSVLLEAAKNMESALNAKEYIVAHLLNVLAMGCGNLECF
jgi:hypothetical protein